MKYKILILTLLLSFHLVSAGAIFPENSYRKYQEINLPKINVPTVTEISFTGLSFERYDFLVSDKTQEIFIPSLLLSEVKPKVLDISALDLNSGVHVYANPSIELPINNNQIGRAEIVVTGPSITTNTLFLVLDNYVALPQTISISANTIKGLKTVLATKSVDSQIINFPQVTADKFIISLTYGQPLIINKLRFSDLSDKSQVYKLRFLAQPNHKYVIYSDPDRKVSLTLGETGNLFDGGEVVKIEAGKFLNNPNYVIADTDNDGIPDIKDNCVSVANKDQTDLNNNSRGDACEDFDRDGIINSLDNCPDLPNVNQEDRDGDKIGNICDAEESRLTEKYEWLPWLGIGLTVIVIIGLFTITALSMRKKNNLSAKK